MTNSGWALAISVVRKLLLARAVWLAGVEAHLRWGYEYHGRGKHQVSLLVTVAMVAVCCSALFLLCGGIVAWALRSKPAWRHWVADTILFSGWCGLAVWVAVTARIVESNIES
ncbi:hypothetical protein FTUN_4673 [Frigoriglobus tundricola]|uniref:Uncharacterized protein n=1 Tax=Frigoriglobus tundricola TaxID=2774151 RepID=A0A6M5YSY5_9BACT|nr:hypothetical protein FTUN_4673 [Frigoriglobus tundricola]